MPVFKIIIGFFIAGVLLFLYYYFFVRRSQTKEPQKSDDTGQTRSLEMLPKTASGGKQSAAKLVHDGNLCPWKSADLTKRNSTIGRTRQNDIVIPRKTISGRHATIAYRENAYFLEDQGSTNGTRLNDTKIGAHKRVPLKNGDRIDFADTQFKFLIQEQVSVGEIVMLTHSFLPIDTGHMLANHSPTSAESEKPNTTQTMIIDDEILFRDCLCKHLDRIIDLGPIFEAFVNTNFTASLINRLCTVSKENMERAYSGQKASCVPLAHSPILFNLCALPFSIETAKTWFTQTHGGFIEYIHHASRAADLKVSGCSAFCMIAYGRTSRAWLSVTLFQSPRAAHPVEIISTELLSDAETGNLSMVYGHLDQG